MTDIQQRSANTLQPATKWIGLWALGVGAVISGDFFGWQFGLLAGGFLGLLIATLLMAGLYICLVFSIAELSAALPNAGGLYAFTRHALGHFIGYMCGICTAIEYVVTSAVIGLGISTYLHSLLPAVSLPVWWLVIYVIFLLFNIRGVSVTFRVSCVVTLMAVLVLMTFYFTTLLHHHFAWSKLFTITPRSGHSSALPFGWLGVMAAIPSAIWFFLAVEELPMAAEETVNVKKHMPRALTLSVFTLLLLALLTLVLNSGVGAGAHAVGASLTPLRYGLAVVFAGGHTTEILTAFALTGLIASFHCVLYGASRILFAFGRDGYLPRRVGATGRNKTPVFATLLAGGLGLFCVFLVNTFNEKFLGIALINMAIFGAVLSYLFVLCGFIKLRLRQPDLPRPYVSPLGLPGAIMGLGLALFALAATLMVPELRPGIWGLCVVLLFAIGYYFFKVKPSVVDVAV